MPTAMAAANCCSGAPLTVGAPMPSTASRPMGFGRCLREHLKCRSQVSGLRCQETQTASQVLLFLRLRPETCLLTPDTCDFSVYNFRLAEVRPMRTTFGLNIFGVIP